MRIAKIPKGRSGGTRTIYMPSAAEKAELRKLLDEQLSALVEDSECAKDVVHGFIRLRSPVTNALCHVGYQYSLCFDLADFFDTVTAAHLTGKLDDDVLSKVLVDGAARQGLPTSPAVANLAASDMDRSLFALIADGGRYSRYADDMTFSFNDQSVIDRLLNQVPVIVRRHGFALNEAKTRLQCADAGRRIITGVAVDGAIHPTRAAKRRHRAARHQGHSRQARGLAEWCALKTPRSTRPAAPMETAPAGRRSRYKHGVRCRQRQAELIRRMASAKLF